MKKTPMDKLLAAVDTYLDATGSDDEGKIVHQLATMIWVAKHERSESVKILEIDYTIEALQKLKALL